MGLSIAIDGPAGAGKSTIAKLLAKSLAFIYVDTGALYRAIALYLLEQGVDTGSEEAVEAALDRIDVSLSYVGGEQHVILNGENVSSRIRTEEVGNIASSVSVYGDVRSKLLELQRGLARRENVVMDGRDIGSFVLPAADLKIYLTASVATRARRRYDEILGKGQPADLKEIQRAIKERDNRDKNRPIAPLIQAEDAVLVDSSNLGIQEVVDTILNLARRSEKFSQKF